MQKPPMTTCCQQAHRTIRHTRDSAAPASGITSHKVTARLRLGVCEFSSADQHQPWPRPRKVRCGEPVKQRMAHDACMTERAGARRGARRDRVAVELGKASACSWAPQIWLPPEVGGGLRAEAHWNRRHWSCFGLYPVGGGAWLTGSTSRPPGVPLAGSCTHAVRHAGSVRSSSRN